MIVICNDTRMAQVLEDHVGRKDQGGPELQNPANGEPARTVRIDSKLLKDAEARDDVENATVAEEPLRRIVATGFGSSRQERGASVEPSSSRNAVLTMPCIPAGRPVPKQASDTDVVEGKGAASGPLWASHSNSRSLVPHNRQFSDDQIRELIDRGAVIGAVMDAWMLVPGWVRGHTTPQSANVTLDTVVNHIDRVCEIAGNSTHSMIGSDLDGAFGREQCPSDIHTIADLKKLENIFSVRGYSPEDIENVFSANFLRFLRSNWLT